LNACHILPIGTLLVYCNTLWLGQILIFEAAGPYFGHDGEAVGPT